jgi:hypothetical protein
MECARIADLLDPSGNDRNEDRKKRYLVSCWNLADHESMALWNQFHASGQERRKVAIRFKRSELLYLVNSNYFPNQRYYYKTKYHYGKVIYFRLAGANAESLEKAKILFPFFRKEKAFEFEREFRFVIEFHPDNRSGPIGDGYWLGEAQFLDFEIIINPTLSTDDQFKTQQAIKDLGFGEKIKKSDLQNWVKQQLDS